MRYHRPNISNRVALFAVVALLFVGFRQSGAQAPRTLSHQGLLTNLAGDPVPDASRDMTFSLYDLASGGTALWTETKSVSTINGVFQTELGSSTPITGVKFSQDLWLGIKVAEDPEMAGRVKLTSAASAFGLVMPYPDTLEIFTADLGSDGSERFNDDVLVHGNDAYISLFSDPFGAWGSVFALGEISNAGSMRDKWSFARRTFSNGASLFVTYGSDPNFSLNSLLYEFKTSGVLHAVGFTSSGVATAADFEYTVPDTSFVSVSGTAFVPNLIDSETVWNEGAFTSHSNPLPVWANAGVSLPHGATLQSFSCTVYDASAAANLQCTLCIRVDESSCGGLASTESSGSAGIGTHGVIPLQKTFDNENESYHIKVIPILDGTAAIAPWEDYGLDLEIVKATIRYTLDGPQ